MERMIWRYEVKIDPHRKGYTETYKPYHVIREDGEKLVICRSKNCITHQKMSINLYRPTWWQNKIIVHTPVEEIEAARRIAWRYLLSDLSRAEERAMRAKKEANSYLESLSPELFTDSQDLLGVVNRACRKDEAGNASPFAKSTLVLIYTAGTDLPKMQ